MNSQRPGIEQVTPELLQQRMADIQQRIVDAGGDVERTKILGVTKTLSVDVVNVALSAGLTELGENYAQELEGKAAELRSQATDLPSPSWHFIGGLQRNKVRRIAAEVAVWQTVDRESLAGEIAKRAPGARIFVQVNTTDEPQKSGVARDETLRLVEHCRQAGLAVEGLMTIGPTDGSDPSPCFSLLRKLAEQAETFELSMGMSGDLDKAVAEGSTMIRVGTALFGPRS